MGTESEGREERGVAVMSAAREGTESVSTPDSKDSILLTRTAAGRARRGACACRGRGRGREGSGCAEAVRFFVSSWTESGRETTELFVGSESGPQLVTRGQIDARTRTWQLQNGQQ
jgi:hypothetical protein